MLPIDSLTLKELQPLVHAALRAWRSVGGTTDNLLDSLLIVQEQRSASQSPIALRLAANKVLLSGIEELAQQNERGARVLRARFPDNNTIPAVSNKLNVSEDHVSRLQREAIQQLTEILLRRETAARAARVQMMEGLLPPPPYDALFGLEEARDSLLEQLVSPQTPAIINIVGIGGIGKTSLADAVVREIIHHNIFETIIWLRVGSRPMSGHYQPLSLEALIDLLAERLWPERTPAGSPTERLNQVRQALKAQPHLIIIDNLETEADTAYLWEHLADLAGPGKFLLTSRARPLGQPGAFIFPLDQLDFDNTAALIRHQAQITGITDLAASTDEEIKTIYNITGGNPLAVKLAVSLAGVMPLPQILADLQEVQAESVERMYRHIYRASWRILSPDARQLLQAMPLVAESGQPEQLQEISGLSPAQVWPAINELVSRSLIEVRGTVWERRYGIHQLTETFILAEIVDWPESDII